MCSLSSFNFSLSFNISITQIHIDPVYMYTVYIVYRALSYNCKCTVIYSVCVSVDCVQPERSFTSHSKWRENEKSSKVEKERERETSRVVFVVECVCCCCVPNYQQQQLPQSSSLTRPFILCIKAYRESLLCRGQRPARHNNTGTQVKPKAFFFLLLCGFFFSSFCLLQSRPYGLVVSSIYFYSIFLPQSLIVYISLILSFFLLFSCVSVVGSILSAEPSSDAEVQTDRI